uniref:UBC core domain-containing protein n=1 Tax=Compsopogon caeruleus TaxID=31354 RepID=A0A7S1TC76_9RHOD
MCDWETRLMKDQVVCPVTECRHRFSHKAVRCVIDLPLVQCFMREHCASMRDHIRSNLVRRSRAGDGPIFMEGQLSIDRNSPESEWLANDPRDAFAPLWRKFESSPRWMCRLCGGEESFTRAERPAYAHCAEARILGLLQITRRLKNLIYGHELGITQLLSVDRSKGSDGHGVCKVEGGKEDRYSFRNSIWKAKEKTISRISGGTFCEGIAPPILASRQKENSTAAYWLCLGIRYLSQDSTKRSWPVCMPQVLEESDFVSILEDILRDTSMIEVLQSPEIYLAALRCIVTLCSNPYLGKWNSIQPNRNIGDLLKSISEDSLHHQIRIPGQAPDVMEMYIIEHLMRARRLIQETQEFRSRLWADLPLDHEEHLLEATYERALEPLRLLFVPSLSEIFSFKAEAASLSKVSGVIPQSTKRLARISREVASLSTSLPLSYNSSIFVRVDQDRYDCMRALILGPGDSPYANGAFEFDIFLPESYPRSPPLVNFLTTNGGQVRFNPNLYENGKVCLSLLGTWAGPSWEESSTILQVLVSLQGLVLISRPYFNEPGFAAFTNEKVWQQKSEAYNERIRFMTVRHAMLGALRSSSLFFPVLQKHFFLKRDQILDTARAWAWEGLCRYAEDGSAFSTQRFCWTTSASISDYHELAALLMELKPVR